ncbi:MAG: F-type H+-transporting ATPase subunit b [Desulfovibrionales bacterium]|jgi:F-type H+-transporting ATPase subunit b|nr:F-type H+-transporting ATPase subunit b [Desulfovibrionales bacterium]
MVTPDKTFFIQLVNFIITLLVLNLLLFRPIREIIKKRAEIMNGRLDDIERFNGDAKSKLANYEKALDEARRSANTLRAEKRAEGLAEEKDFLEVAGKEAADSLKTARGEIDAQMRKAKDALAGEVKKFAQQATDKILGEA